MCVCVGWLWWCAVLSPWCMDERVGMQIATGASFYSEQLLRLQGQAIWCVWCRRCYVLCLFSTPCTFCCVTQHDVFCLFYPLFGPVHTIHPCIAPLTGTAPGMIRFPCLALKTNGFGSATVSRKTRSCTCACTARSRCSPSLMGCWQASCGVFQKRLWLSPRAAVKHGRSR